MSEQNKTMPTYIQICGNSQSSGYDLYNTQHEVTVQVNEYLIREERIQNLANELRLSALEK